jgi:plastocyanin
MKITSLTFAFIASVTLLGCGDDSSTSDLATTQNDLSMGPAKIEGCGTADFIDKTAGGATISPWDTSLGSTPQCFKIKVNQTVTWVTPSATHPLRATGGDTPTPIMNDNAATVTFPNAGTYGFHCGVHLGIMHGAILVVP